MSYSKTIIVGRCGRDPELRYTTAGVAVADVSIAEDRGFGEKKQTVWWRVSFWRDAAESVKQHVHKGDALILEGMADASAWVADDGEARASLELTAYRWQFAPGNANADGREEQEQMPF